MNGLSSVLFLGRLFANVWSQALILWTYRGYKWLVVVVVYKYEGGGVGTGMFLDWQEEKKNRGEVVKDSNPFLLLHPNFWWFEATM